jgi:hypothetical protein
MMTSKLPPPLPFRARPRAFARRVGALVAMVTIAVAAFVAGRLSTTSWPIVADACVEYGKMRAEFVKAEREFEAKHSPYRYPVHAAVFRVYERPEAYLHRVATKARYDGYVERRDDCVRQLAARR